jgi:hypothetical protein
MRRVAYIGAIVLLLVSLGGVFIASTMLRGMHPTMEHAAYGETPIPGHGSVHLPAGQITISLHAVETGNPTGPMSIPPDLKMTIVPPAGADQPPVTKNVGTTTTVKSDRYRPVWVAQIAQEGDYDVSVVGTVNGYLSPRLAFGFESTKAGFVAWLFPTSLVVALLAFAVLMFFFWRK